MAMAMEREPVRAPQLRGTAWLNTERPLTLADLRGKLVLLDFWTYGCINCIHVFEDLKYLEHKYAARPFVIIGVHSPKFANEDDPATVREAVLRYGIKHPVLLDSGRRTWDAYAVRGWPTLVLVDPRGYLLGQVSGEGHRETLDAAIGRALDLLEAGGALDPTPLPIRLEAEGDVQFLASPLLFPGKVLADAESDSLFVADAGHHRIVWTTLDGQPRAEIGSGSPGAEDGEFDSAAFHSPQGLALDRERGWLYVADTANHLIRRVDLRARTVVSAAGTGTLDYRRSGSGPARATPLNSPWDVCLLDGVLYIAMAGLHQLWSYVPASETVAVVAGSGAEGRADGPGETAALAQPSGLATDGTRLYVADSESSSIREVTVGAVGAEVRTLAGGDLFLFGNVDGRGDDVRFQHPLGVAWAPEGAPGGAALYVADTYNHTIRRLVPATGEVTRFAGSGASGASDGPAPTAGFSEPSGLSYANGRLYVADTNNHRVRTIELNTGEVAALTLAGLCAPGLCLPG